MPKKLTANDKDRYLVNYREIEFFLGSHPVVVAGMAHPGMTGSRIIKSNIDSALDVLDESFDTIISLEEAFSKDVAESFKKKTPFNKSLAIIIEDFHAPSLEQFDHFYTVVTDAATKGGNIVIHCRGGYGRTGTMLASLALHELLEAAIHSDPSLANYDMKPAYTLEVFGATQKVSQAVYSAVSKIRSASFEEPSYDGLAVETEEQLQSLIDLERALVAKHRNGHSRRLS